MSFILNPSESRIGRMFHNTFLTAYLLWIWGRNYFSLYEIPSSTINYIRANEI